MANRVEFIFDFVSPNGYLIWKPLREMLDRTGAGLDIFPVFLGGMHKLTGNAPPMIRDAEVKGKNEYAALETRRFIAKHGLTKFKLHPKFPFNTVTLQRMLVAAEEDGRAVQFCETILPAVWEDGADVLDPEVLGGILTAGGFDAKDLFERSQTPEVKQKLIDNTSNAVERGTFGIPTMFVGDEMFFGKERLGQIEEELTKG